MSTALARRFPDMLLQAKSPEGQLNGGPLDAMPAGSVGIGNGTAGLQGTVGQILRTEAARLKKGC